MDNLAKGVLVFCILSIFSLKVYAQTRVVVIPMGGDAAPLQNVVTVAKKNGDYTDPVAAMKSIEGMANKNNRYLVFIGPGVYTLTERLVMQEYVDISGSGQDATKLTGAISANVIGVDAALVSGANHAGIRGLSIVNTGGSDSVSIGFSNHSLSPNMSDMTISVSGASHNYGVLNAHGSSPRMFNMTITASGDGLNNYGVENTNSSSSRMSNMSVMAFGGNYNYGVRIDNTSSPRISNMDISVSGDGSNRGVSIRESSPILSDISIVVSGGSYHVGIESTSNSSPTISGTTIVVTEGTHNYGVKSSASLATISGTTIETSGGSSINIGVKNNSSAAAARIYNSTISSAGTSVAASDGWLSLETLISDSILKGVVTGSPICDFVFTDLGIPMTDNCVDPTAP